MLPMTKHRFTSLAIATAVALSLPASASAKLVYDNGVARTSPKQAQPAVKSGPAPAAIGGCRAAA